MASNGWLNRFKFRYGLSLKSSKENIAVKYLEFSQPKKVNDENLSHHVMDLSVLLKGFNDNATGSEVKADEVDEECPGTSNDDLNKLKNLSEILLQNIKTEINKDEMLEVIEPETSETSNDVKLELPEIPTRDEAIQCLHKVKLYLEHSTTDEKMIRQVKSLLLNFGKLSDDFVKDLMKK